MKFGFFAVSDILSFIILILFPIIDTQNLIVNSSNEDVYLEEASYQKIKSDLF